MNVEIASKYVVVTENSCFCSECQGKDSLPEFFDSYEDALDSFYQVALEGLEYADEDFLVGNSSLALPQIISEMRALKEGKNIAKMEGFILLNPHANYFDESIIKAETFILERIGIFRERGLTFKGVPLENLKLSYS